jgi:hypothetical protein
MEEWFSSACPFFTDTVRKPEKGAGEQFADFMRIGQGASSCLLKVLDLAQLAQFVA